MAVTVAFGAAYAASAISALAALRHTEPRAVLPVTATGALILAIAALVAAILH
ncbi:hypothetical protein [Streptomyces arenae]|uniref:hypothetical protein n=1 Tax=Streptomyces arenae TaxID=29301 RepID=UPI00265AD0EE|nr:hypothetical protein [Streptomyces arenae]MCG7203977.1 hypothetical protein [Streptomyces arenae]